MKILVTYPVAGDAIRVGSHYVIKWENIGVTSNVKITLRESSGSTEVIEIVDDIYNTGFHLWKVPSNLDPDTDYFIRIESLESSPIVGDGTYFEIKAKFSMADFSDLLNLQKIILVEIKAGLIINTVFVGNRFLLKEDGDFLLLESGDKIILEQSIES